MRYTSKRVFQMTGLVGSCILLVGAYIYHESLSEIQVSRRKLRSALIQLTPNATNWSRSQKIVRALSKQIPPERLQDEIERHRTNLVRLGYFEVVEIPIPNVDAYRKFQRGAFMNKWECDLWSFSGYTGTVRLTAFTGDVPAWVQLGEDSSKGAVQSSDR